MTAQLRLHEHTLGEPTVSGSQIVQCGRHIFSCVRAGKHYWEAAGPLLEVWERLIPELRELVDSLSQKEAFVTAHIVMVGGSKHTASPCVLFSTQDLQQGGSISQDEPLKGIMMKYPTVGVEVRSDMAEHLVADENQIFPSRLGGHRFNPEEDHTEVWTPINEKKMGRAFYVPNRSGGPMRLSTAGPIFFTETRAYQTTVRHVFTKSDKSETHGCEPSFQNDLDLEALDYEDDNEAELEDVDTGRHKSVDIPSTNESVVREIEFSHMFGNTNPVFRVDDRMDEFERTGGEHGNMAIRKDLCYAEKVVRETLTRADRPLDYALVEVEVDDDDDPNLVCYDPSNSLRKVRVSKVGRISEMERNVSLPVVVVTSLGPVTGKLITTTPGHMSSNLHDDVETIYPVIIDGGHTLGPSDRGAAVIETIGGNVYGHILFEVPGSPMAYILPMERIIMDMARALNLDPLHGIYLQPKKHRARGVKKEPRVHAEFASPEFYREINNRVMPKRHPFRSLYRKARSKAGNHSLLKRNPAKLRHKMNRTFNSLFFSMPAEIRDEVIEWLDFRSAMNLRQVSRTWRAAVSVNGSAISTRFLVHNPLPRLAHELYPCPSPNPDLLHIQKVGQCHAVASRLADHIATWLRKEIYLYKSGVQEAAFQAMKLQIKRRLVPSLFLLGHFFQQYSQCLLSRSRNQNLNGSAPGFHIERSIMEAYDSRLMIQTQHVMLILVTFLKRSVRPPSKYGSLERLLHRYLKKPASDDEVSTVLCIGGLDKVVKLLDISNYDKRLAALRSYLASLSQETVESTVSISPSDSPKRNNSHSLADEEDDKILSTSTSTVRPCQWKTALPFVPQLDSLWTLTAAKLLEEQKIAPSINTYEQALKELISKDNTIADDLYREGHDLWHALSDKEARTDGIASDI